MATKPVSIDFYHDVVCGWCFVLSPRLHQVVADFDVKG